MARTSERMKPRISGMIVSWRCWRIRSPMSSRCSAIQTQSMNGLPGCMVSGPDFFFGLLGLDRPRFFWLGRLERLGEGRGVIACPHLLGDGVYGQQALDGAVAIDNDPGLDVGVEHHRQGVLERRPLIDGRR